jgi:hypothetical protein
METVYFDTNVSASLNIEYVRCEECNHEYEFTASVDRYGDLQIHVVPHKCEAMDE